MTKCAHCEAFKGSYCLRNNSIKIVKFIPYSVDSNLNEIECGDFIQLSKSILHGEPQMKDDILNNLILTLDIPDKSIEILSKPNGQIEIGNGMSVTADELRQIVDLSDQFAIWIKQMRNYSK